MGRDVYDTEVVGVGELADTSFAEGVLVLFGEEAPPELAEYSVIHRPSLAEQGPEPRASVYADDTPMRARQDRDAAARRRPL